MEELEFPPPNLETITDSEANFEEQTFVVLVYIVLIYCPIPIKMTSHFTYSYLLSNTGKMRVIILSYPQGVEIRK